MSPKNPSIIAGLAAPGLLWLATTVAFGQGVPTPQGPPPTVPASASPTHSVLLLSNGTVVKGEITEDAPAGLYRLKQKGGMVPYPKSSVKKAAQSVEEIYEFLVASLPVGDPDERMKLVRWCLTEHLKAQAKEQLAAVLALCPDDVVAQQMQFNLTASAEHAKTLDSEVRQAGLEIPRADVPAPIPATVLKGLRKGFNVNTPPEIFDLPQAQAVAAAMQFRDRVHPVIQQNCAVCHNEKYPGTFQLVQVRNKKDLLNSDIIRTNLDATIRLINPDDPSRSDILSLGLVPHGSNKAAIFSGPNSQPYQILSIWVKSLKSPKASATARAGSIGEGRTRANDAPGELPAEQPGFGSDRGGRSGAPRNPSSTPDGLPALPGMDLLSASQLAAPGRPSRGTVEHYEEQADFSGNANAKFEVPYAAGGPPPKRTAPPMATSKNPRAGTPQPATADPFDEDEATSSKPVVPTTAQEVAPGKVVVGPNDNPNLLPGMNQPLYRTPPKAEADKKKAKPKIDPAELEKLMKNRNNNP